jgi:hypothetical protein
MSRKRAGWDGHREREKEKEIEGRVGEEESRRRGGRGEEEESRREEGRATDQCLCILEHNRGLDRQGFSSLARKRLSNKFGNRHVPIASLLLRLHWRRR